MISAVFERLSALGYLSSIFPKLATCALTCKLSFSISVIRRKVIAEVTAVVPNAVRAIIVAGFFNWSTIFCFLDERLYDFHCVILVGITNGSPNLLQSRTTPPPLLYFDPFLIITRTKVIC